MLLVLLLVASVLPTTAGASEGGGQPFPPVEDRVPDQILVRFHDAVPAAAREKVLANAGAKTLSVIEQLEVHVARVPEHAAKRVVAALQRSPMVEYAEFDTVVELAETAVVPNDPEYYRQWGIARTRTDAAWAMTTGSTNVVIAVLDSGVAPVADLQTKLLRGRNVLTGTSDTSDANGHGTSAAGVAAAATDNGIGVAGYGWNSMILPVKVLDGFSGNMSDLAAGITWATDSGAHVISMSLSGPSGTTTLLNAVRYARDRNVNLVAAAGNQSDTTQRYPAAYAEVIGVAGTQDDDTLYSWSSYGSWVDVAAPGVNRTTHVTGSYTNFAGTSSATPAVAGVLGLLRATGAGAAVARTALQDGSDALSVVRYGRVNTLTSLDLLGVTSDPEPEPIGPTAGFTWTCVDLHCDFADGSQPGDAPLVGWAWAFGDGASSSGSTTSHSFETAAIYTVSLTVTDADGLAARVDLDVEVAAQPPAPDPEPDPEPTPDPEPEPAPDPGVELHVTTSKVRGVNVAQLAWSGAESEAIDVRLNGATLARVANGGRYQHDTGLRGNPTLSYQVCEVAPDGRCSDELVVSSW